jgi:superfamily I DNA/RNA helicase
MAFSFIRQGIPCRIEGKDIGTGLKNLCKKWRVQTLVKLTERLNAYSMREQEKWEKKDEPMMMEQVSDKVNTLLALIARCQELNQHSVNDVNLLIDSMFSDSADVQQNILTLCSVHKSKGLEWDRVFLLDRPQFMPSKMARKDWQKVQENNLIYVAITRAINELVEIVDYPSPNA